MTEFFSLEIGAGSDKYTRCDDKSEHARLVTEGDIHNLLCQSENIKIHVIGCPICSPLLLLLLLFLLDFRPSVDEQSFIQYDMMTELLWLSGLSDHWTLNREVPGSNLLAAAVVPLGKVLYHHCLVPRKGLKAVVSPGCLWL